MSWSKVKLKDVLKQYRIEHRVQDSTEYKQVSILNNGNVVVRGSKIGREIGRKRQFIIDVKKYPNTLIFTRQLLLQGSIGIANEEVDQCIVTENMPMFSINTDLINVEFLFLFLKSEVFKSQIRKIELSGSAQKSIHEKTFLELEFLLPKLETQNEIAKVISSFNKENENISTELKQQLEYVKQLRQAFLREAMQGHFEFKQQPLEDGELETGAQLLEKIKAEKAQLIKEKKLKKEKELPPITEDEIPFEIPEHWTWCRLGEVTTLLTDGKHGDSKNEKDSGYYFLSAKDIQNGKFIYENARQITYDDFIETHRRTNLEPGDLCIVNTGATIGKTAFAPEDERTSKTTFQKSVAILKVLSEYTSMKYLEYFIISETPNLLKKSRGSAINNLLLGDMKNLMFPLPPLIEQQQIVAKLNELMAFCDVLEESIKESQGLNEKLLQEVLREALQGRKLMLNYKL